MVFLQKPTYSMPPSSSPWSPPPLRTLKINSDASFVHESKLAAAGAGCRDNVGNWVKGCFITYFANYALES